MAEGKVLEIKIIACILNLFSQKYLDHRLKKNADHKYNFFQELLVQTGKASLTIGVHLLGRQHWCWQFELVCSSWRPLHF